MNENFMRFWSCVAYLVSIGVLSFFVGRLLAKIPFHADRIPFRSTVFEKKSAIYERIRIKRWQNKLPDMSRILPKLIPAKKICAGFRRKLPQMIRETCVAEVVHGGLAVAGLYCIKLWSSIGGVVLAVLFALGNIPFILIQRYNRPRLLRILEREYQST